KVNNQTVTSGTQNSLNAGTYTITETGPTGYTGTFSGDCNPGGSITLKVGDVKACVLTNNDAAPTLTVVKLTVPGADPGKFDLKIGGNVVATAVGNNGTSGAVPVSIGTHSVSEVGVMGTDLASYKTTFAGACDATGKVTLTSLGQQAICYVINTNNICLPPVIP
ncbi:MAG: hypothetical protein ACRD96_10100, partial [Bryobacteraceae bacterium]